MIPYGEGREYCKAVSDISARYNNAILDKRSAFPGDCVSGAGRFEKGYQ